VSPPPPAPEPPPPPPAAPAFSLEGLRAQDASRLSADQVAGLAASIGIEATAIRAVIQVESAGAGFSADGRPVILFEPAWFREATGGRFDASHPALSPAAGARVNLGRTQAERWAMLSQAFALDPAAALSATSWGTLQTPGRYFRECGYASVEEMVSDLSRSETRQLAAFERYLRSQGLIDELQRRDWAGFARAYEGEAGAGQYASALERAYRTLSPPPPTADFLTSLRAQDPRALTVDDFAAAAQRLGCEREAIQAIVQVESGPGGAFGPDGRPVILYEPHIFSRRTQRRYDASHPNISYPSWDRTRYPRDQAGRWSQLAEAFALDPENAVASASYGLFQIMGFNHRLCGFDTAQAFVADYCQSQVRQLMAFEAYIRNTGLTDELQRLDWEGFARGYNGPGQVERYGRLMREAYNRLKGIA
jgi:N-acetylmuramidase